MQPCTQTDTIQDIRTDVAILKASDERHEGVLERMETKIDKILYFILGIGVTAIGGLAGLVIYFAKIMG
jgi:hypothetical protein